MYNNLHKIKKTLKKARQTIGPFTLTTLFFMSSGLLKDAIKGDEIFCKGISLKILNLILIDFEKSCSEHQVLIPILVLVVLLISGIWGFIIINNHLPIKRLEPNKEVTAHKAMAFSVSLLSKNDTFTVQLDTRGNPKSIIYPNRSEELNKIKTVELKGNIAEDIKEVPYSTQHFLRALQPHTKTLQKLHLLGSRDREGNGSFRQLNDYINLARTYCRANIECTHAAVDFEDAFAVYTELGDWVKKATSEIGDDEVILDITCGTKPTSVGTALATLNNFSRFQYVQTAEPFSVVMYELTFQSEPRLKSG